MSQIEGFALALQRRDWNQEGFVLHMDSPRRVRRDSSLKTSHVRMFFWGIFLVCVVFFFLEDYIKKAEAAQTDWLIIKALQQLQYVSVLAWPRGGKL